VLAELEPLAAIQMLYNPCYRISMLEVGIKCFIVVEWNKSYCRKAHQVVNIR